jgi:hypothetical protein
VSERTDYPRHVAQLALAHEADGGVVNVDFDWRPKNNVSNYASAEGTAMSDKSFERSRQGRRRVQRAAIGNVTPMSLIGTFETCRWTLKMAAFRCRLEVVGAWSKRRF